MTDQTQKEEKQINGPLDGVRILDLTTGQHGPVATSMLADMGADVIKIEDNMGGDTGRFFNAVLGFPVEKSFYFEPNNRSKRSLKIDLKKPESKEIIHRLLETHDVFVTNYREKAIKKLGMDYDSLSAICPQLIHVMAYGLGQKGPDAAKPLLDLGAQARGGLWSISGEPGGVPPKIGAGMADQMGACMLAYGIMLGLFARERTGIGQEINTSLFGSQVWLGSIFLQAYLFYNETIPPLARDKGENPLWNHYKCKDDKWICLSMLGTDPYWHEFCEAMGIEHLENDDKFKEHELRKKNSVDLIAVLDERFASENQAEWITRFRETDLIWAPVQDYEEVANDPQVLANDYVVDYDHPKLGPVKMVGQPVKLSKTPGKIQRPAPDYGEHTQEILLEAGYSWEEIEKLVIAEVI